MTKPKRAASPEKKTAYQYPSFFGSHKSMVIAEKENGMVTCKDEFGEYETYADRLDNGLTDPRRTASHRLRNLTG